MDEIRIEPTGDEPTDPTPVAPAGRVERHEVIETSRPDSPARRKEGTSMAFWLIPLVLVVIGLMWYVMQEGSPDSPLPERGVELEAPEVEAPAVISTPAGES